MTNSTFPISYRDPVYAAADQSASDTVGIPPGLLTSIRVAGEKSNANQVSSAGAQSVYQFTPATRQLIIQKYKIDPLASPEAAALGAAYLLKEGIQRTGSAAGAVTQYIGGTDPANWGGQTRAYTNRVMTNFVKGGGQDTPQPDAQPSAPLPSAASYGLDPSVVGLGGGNQSSPAPAQVSAPQAAAPGANVNQQIVADYNAGRLSPEDMADVQKRAPAIGIDPSQLQAPAQAAPAAEPAPAQPKQIGPQTLAALQAGTLTPDQQATIKAGVANGSLIMPQQAPAQNAGTPVDADGFPSNQAPTTAAQNGSTLSDVAEKGIGGIAGSLLDIASAGGRMVGATDFANGAQQAHQQIDAQMAKDTNNSTAGKVAGVVGSAVPYAAMGGASLTGSAVGGAVAGAAPAIAGNKSIGETARDAAFGAGAGAAGFGAGKALGSVVGSIAENPTVAKAIAKAKSLFGAAPSDGNKVAQAGGVRDAQDAADIANASGQTPAQLATKLEAAPAPKTPGYTPTAAEMAQDANVTTVQKASTNAQPSTYANASADNDAAVAKSLSKPASGEVAGSGKFSDGESWDASYTTQENTDGTHSLIRDLGDGPYHLRMDGVWYKGRPPKTQVFGAEKIEGPETFPSAENALDAAREDVESMGGKTAGNNPGTPAAPQAADQAVEAAAQKSDALAAKGQTEIPPLSNDAASQLSADQYQSPIKLAKKIASDEGSTVFDDHQAARQADAAKTLEQIIGTPEQLGAAKAARSSQASDALKNVFTGAGESDPRPVLKTIDALLAGPSGKRPAVRQSLESVRSILVEPNGVVMNDPETLYNSVRKAIDDMTDTKMNQADQKGVMATKQLLLVKKSLDDVIEQGAPGFKKYLSDFSEASGPINSMESAQSRLYSAVNPATGEIAPAKLVNAINSIKAEQMKAGAKAADSVPKETIDALTELAKHLQNKNDLTGLPAEGQEYIRRALASNPDRFGAAHQDFQRVLNASPSYAELHGPHAQHVATVESTQTSQTALARAQEIISGADSPAGLRAIDKELPNMEAADKAKAIALRQAKARELAMGEVQERNLNSRGATEFNRNTFRNAADKYSPFMASDDASQFGNVAQDLHNQTVQYAKTGKLGGSDTNQNQNIGKRLAGNIGDAIKDRAVQAMVGGSIGSAAGLGGATAGALVGVIAPAIVKTITQKVSNITGENAAKLLSNGKLLASALRNYESLAARRLFVQQLSSKIGYAAGTTVGNQVSQRRRSANE